MRWGKACLDSRLQAVAVGKESSSSCSRVCRPPAEFPEPQRAFRTLVSSSLVSKCTLILHSRESLYQVWTFSSKPSLMFQNSTQLPVKLCFHTKKILPETHVLNKCSSRLFQWQGPPFLLLVLLGISIPLSSSPRAVCLSWLVKNPSVITAPTASTDETQTSELLNTYFPFCLCPHSLFFSFLSY